MLACSGYYEDPTLSFPKGSSTQYQGTWPWGKSSCNTGFGEHMIIGCLDP